ncbi:MAG: hypothetical protein ABJB86_11125 [Bacteroidota bacterium]
MLRKVVIFLVMLVHINGSMLLPQTAEQDIYDEQGQQKKDINTVIEYVDEIILGNHDKNPIDQDNDQGQNFHLVKMVDYYFEIDFTPVKRRVVIATAKEPFNIFSEEKLHPVTLDILAPPPKA